MNWLTDCKPQFCGFGVVVGEDGKKLKTRAGETIKLQGLIDEAVKQAGEQIKLNGKGQEYSEEEIKSISQAVGISAIKYADMCSQRTKDYRFSYEKMLNFKGNTASYMLYSYARINNIVKKADIQRDQLYSKENLEKFIITENPERVILLTLLKFDSIITEVSGDLMPHHLCEWMYSLSGNFTDFYEKCRVIQPDGSININRMILCEMVRKALDISFHLLGLKSIERM